MMIALTVHLSAHLSGIIAPGSLAPALRLIATGSKMLACAAALWLLLALPGFVSEQNSLLAEAVRPGPGLLAKH